MKVLFLTKYDQLAANTRYRCLQYIPYLQKQGIDCTVSPLLDDDYLRFKFSKGHYPVFAILTAYWKRFAVLVKIKSYDLVVLHYELFPYFPATFEKLFSWLHIRYVYDFDDAIYHHYDEHSNPVIRFLLRKKIANVIRNASAVLAGNSYLADYASHVSKNIHIIPTVVDPERYVLGRALEERDPDRPFTIGWIGSPSTVTYVKEKAGALRTFCLRHNAQLVLVGSGPIELPGIPLIVKEWSEETELEELKTFDVGIMPLTDDAWSRGKCGFKLIQYMACALPVIASPVGVNRELVEPGKTGYLATSDEEWIQALEHLYAHRQVGRVMGRQGLLRVLEKYSVPRFAPQVGKVLWDSIDPARRVELTGNVDTKVARNFGEEWIAFPQTDLPRSELKKIFKEYFSMFPWELVDSKNAIGADLGCGSGRWSLFTAPLVKKLFCLDASDSALKVAKENLREFQNIEYVHANIGNLPFEDGTLDFAYSIGVLHHIPDPQKGLKVIAQKLKPGAPFLVYIYYAFDNRGGVYKLLWHISDLARRWISRLPFGPKYWVSQILALTIYWPLARLASVLAWLGILPDSWTLSYYRDKSFYIMRNDALDRFGTRLEKRFSRTEIETLLKNAGFENIRFSENAPYWVAVGTRAATLPNG